MTITIPVAGTYLLMARTNLAYIAATFAASQFFHLGIWRQNNTVAVINQSKNRTRIITTVTDGFGSFNLDPFVYTTANTNDILSLEISVKAAPSAGSFTVFDASLIAVRLY
jgi:hypothetical protein